jgi:hypothetical protein
MRAVDQRARFDFDSLGVPGRARGVDDIGEIFVWLTFVYVHREAPFRVAWLLATGNFVGGLLL